ncbi:metal-dependent hydrolase family protein [Saccharomonospora cyanea]|uniref:Amidohydrolase, imidazolonepropionase n=1 Tax=Saccharomonospora cyanea NA-134 TaxID=882082 RepID=H5XJA1_9PSEU|nr:amidohydrolase family protein [Saccharomonospora cyanea]EHR62911.1 amidohydrolase, imidazolonepropionase [Saccharomonospora cyanea NA-134]
MTRTVFRGGTVFDAVGRAAEVADVAVEEGVIAEVGPDLDGDTEVDCTGQGVLPGLFDCHVHLTMSDTDLFRTAQEPFSLQFFEAAINMAATLAAGVTTVRDAGGADLGVRVAQERGLVAGPRTQVSLNMLSQTGGHGDPWWPSTCVMDLLPPHPGRPPVVVDGPEEIRRKIRELVRAGADVIKVATSGGIVSSGAGPEIPHFRDDEIAMMVTEASAARRFVMAHAHGAGAKAAVRNGVRSIEHGSHLDDETLEEMARRRVWLVPTLASGLGLRESLRDGATYPDHIREKIERMGADRSVRRAIEAGVPIAMGTDAPLYPHGKNLMELPLLVEQGMTPADALHAATLSAAELMGLHRSLGSIEPGKRADLVIVDGDPLRVHDLGERVRAVYQDGRAVHVRPDVSAPVQAAPETSDASAASGSSVSR